MNKQCRNCFGTIHVMCNLGQDYCSENCRKALEQKEVESREALDLLREKLTKGA